MNRIVMAAVLLLFFSAEAYAKDLYIVTVHGLRMREAPSLKSREIKQLARGAVVEMLGSSENTEEIDGHNFRWYRVRIDGTQGWAYGAYLVPGYIDQRREVVAWIGPRVIKKEISFWFHLVSAKEKKESSFKVKCLAPGPIALSKGLRYVAIDDGTDVVGRVLIYGIPSGRLLCEESYCPRGNLKWDGEKFRFRRVTYLGNGCHWWEEETFDDGRIIKGPAKGRGEYHGAGDIRDPKCD